MKAYYDLHIHTTFLDGKDNMFEIRPAQSRQYRIESLKKVVEGFRKMIEPLLKNNSGNGDSSCD